MESDDETFDLQALYREYLNSWDPFYRKKWDDEFVKLSPGETPKREARQPRTPRSSGG